MKENISDYSDLKIKARDFKCPCGKGYLSYPALFTHIKQKHSGKAPGQIQRPSKHSRGNHILMECHRNLLERSPWDDAKPQTRNHQRLEQDFQAQKTSNGYWEEFSYLFTLLKKVEKPEKTHIKLWTSLESFRKLQAFLDERQQQGGNEGESGLGRYCLGNSLSQFFKAVSQGTEGWCFEQVLILFMSLLQYVMGENPCRDIIRDSPIDILIEYINPFISYYLGDFVHSNSLNHLWVMRRQNTNRVFMSFYNWLKWKNYTNFCITLIQ